jgi:RNA polymerase sigma-70 factor (ECF subfamily)
MTPPNPFSELVRQAALRLAESGVAALSGLYDLTSARLVRFAVTITGNQHDAEDAVSASLVRVADQPKLLAQTQRPWSYLLQMVRNESLLIARKQQRWSKIDDLSSLQTQCQIDELEQEESYRAVWIALQKLPTTQAEVVVLKIWEDQTFAQIAEILDLSADTAASRYRYGMQKLSRVLQPQSGEVPHA